MLQQSITKKNSLFIFILIIATAACNNADTGKDSSKALSDSNSVAASAMADAVKAATTNQGLDYLWTDTATFLKIPEGKTVFSFSFSLPDSITLNGWYAKGSKEDTYNTPPDIKLMKGQPSGISCGKGTYFGNNLLDKKELKNIKDTIIKLKTLYVLFAPEVKDYHVKYNIVLTNEDPLGATALDKTKLIATGYSLNPSPPHQY